MSVPGKQVAIGLIAALGWPLAMSRVVTSDFYVALAILTTGLAAVIVATHHDRLRAWFPITGLGLAAGFAAGVVHAGLTHIGYRLLSPSIPALREEVIGLYALMGSGLGPIRALPIIILAIVVEELVWRGVLLESSNRKRANVAMRASLSIVLYSLAQLGAGSWALVIAAFSCGLAWWAMRHLSRSLTVPLTMHLVWSLVVLVFVPLERLP